MALENADKEKTTEYEQLVARLQELEEEIGKSSKEMSSETDSQVRGG